MLSTSLHTYHLVGLIIKTIIRSRASRLRVNVIGARSRERAKHTCAHLTAAAYVVMTTEETLASLAMR